MTTITIKTNIIRKIAPYILFIFTVLSFFFIPSFFLYLFVSLATIGFIFVNTTQLFSKERYLSYIEIFSSILLLVRVSLIYTNGLFFVLVIGFILLNFILFYVFYFSNYKENNTNILGIKKEKDYISKKRIEQEDLNDDFEDGGLEEEDLDLIDNDAELDDENNEKNIDSIDDELDENEFFEEEVKSKQKKTQKQKTQKSSLKKKK